MRAVRVHRTGGPEVLQIDEVPEPVPGPGEIQLRVAASGVNFIDVYQRRGLYPRRLPFTLGLEAAGTVAATGAGVSGFEAGDRVAAVQHPGTHAESVAVPADRVVPVPDGVSLETAAAVMIQGLTAHFLATSTVALHEGSRVLVHAAAGGLGLLLSQVAKRSGATVFGTVSSSEKAAIAAAAGVDTVIRYTETDFAQTILDATGGVGVDVVFDSVGRDTFDRSLRCLRPRGYLVLCGQSSGPVAPVDPQQLKDAGSVYLTRPALDDYTRTRAELEARAEALFAWVAAGDLEVRVGERHRLEAAATAYARIESRRTAGKVVLIP